MKLVKGASFLVMDQAPEDVFTPEDFTPEHISCGKTAREFMANEVIPLAGRIEGKDFPLLRELLKKAGDLGLLMADIPEEFGGLALDKTSSAIIAENTAGQGAFQTIIGGQTGIGSLPIVYYGTPRLKAKYLPHIASGDKIGCYALSEPSAGTDALACRTKAVLSADGRHYVLNGTKQFITNAGFADIFIVFAKVDGKDFTGFLLERNTPGLSVGPEEHKMGLKGSSTTTLILDDALVPAENVLGQIGQGHKIAFNILNIGRFKIGAMSVGQSKLAISHALGYTLQRKQFGKRLADFGAIREKLAEMFTRTYATESITYRTVGFIDSILHASGDDHGEASLRSIEEYNLECAAVKISGSESLGFVVDEVVQCFGGYGYCSDYPVEGYYRDARIARIYEGTNEINRIIIANNLLRRFSKGELPENSSLKNGNAPLPDNTGPLGVEQNLVTGLKALAIETLKAILENQNGDAAANQMVLMRLADIFTSVYLAESAMLRAQKDAVRRGEAGAAIPIAAAKIICETATASALDAAMRILIGIGRKDKIMSLRALALRDPVDLISLREFIASELVNAERLIQ